MCIYDEQGRDGQVVWDVTQTHNAKSIEFLISVKNIITGIECAEAYKLTHTPVVGLDITDHNSINKILDKLIEQVK